MRQLPLVSVIIPAYNAADFIEEALDSARRQTYENLEIIVTDDGSDDETPEIVSAAAQEDGRIRLIRQSNQGVAAARNHAIRESNGVFIAPLDADDIWFRRKIERQVQCMRRGGPSVGLVYSWWASISEEGDIVGAANRWEVEGDVFEPLLYRNFIGNASVPLFRRTCLEEVGGYKTSLKEQDGEGCEDWDLSLRIAERYIVRNVPAYLTGYRAVDDSMSRDCESMRRSYELVLKAIKRRHPEISEELIRWSRSNYYRYLANQSYAAGRFEKTLYWLREVVRIDPAALLSAHILKTGLKSAFRHLARPLTSLLWDDHQAWLRFKERFQSKREQSISIDKLQQDAEAVPESWTWNAWKPYGRLCLQRWNSLVDDSECSEVSGAPTEKERPTASTSLA